MSGRVLWINGAFGVGKSTTGLHLLAVLPGWRYFDPEWVGFMLRAQLGDQGVVDFQDIPAWRRLVPLVASEVALHTGEDLVAVQTVTNESYWNEIRDGFTTRGMTVHHVLLDCEPDELRRRIEADEADPKARDWRLGHVDAFVAARPWLTRASALFLDTTSTTAEDVAGYLAAFARTIP